VAMISSVSIPWRRLCRSTSARRSIETRISRYWLSEGSFRIGRASYAAFIPHPQSIRYASSAPSTPRLTMAMCGTGSARPPTRRRRSG
jgi:hypothetical protein